ncbi:pilus assembly protein PilN [Starkeya sp. ORNL1]|uniref:PilN domain-containing protein n=1 Tax=Starkeya sp. ORNL1 TaxID=2709380 RepID=UPI001463C00F|nr:PilN domain-containing protein [Starkeya sp. ORNL1]QJP16352.1 pilus assembly protein PilN [Starkeya sp. ORNL1]
MSLSRIIDGFSAWLDLVAATIVAALARLHKVRSVQLIEGDGGAFSLRSMGAGAAPAHPPFRLDATAAELLGAVAAELHGRDVELVLQPTHFLFRPLELPKRAAEFLDGIVRTQIDRLTPWSANEAVFGWTPPAGMDDDRITLTVAATARARIEPHMQALKALGAKSIVVSTRAAGGGAEALPIKVLEHAASGMLGVARVRQLVLALLVGVSVVATLATVASQIFGGDLDAQLEELNRGIATQRLVLARADQGGETSALRALERRKHASAATVLVLETLSKVLPDHTFVTEMHIEGDKLQVVGISPEAPTLIRLLEQSSHFTQATFFAPTTRIPQEPGDRFHIEARIRIPVEVNP